LLDLAAGTELEEMVTVTEGGLGNSSDADDVEGFVNEMNLLSEDELENMRQKVQLIRLVLVKVRND
jgi:hypothetical protein